MSVLFETSLGELVIDLEVDKCPKTCENFLKLCKIKYYNLNAFFNGEFNLARRVLRRISKLNKLDWISVQRLHRSDWRSYSYWNRRRVATIIPPLHLAVQLIKTTSIFSSRNLEFTETCCQGNSVYGCITNQSCRMR